MPQEFRAIYDSLSMATKLVYRELCRDSGMTHRGMEERGCVVNALNSELAGGMPKTIDNVSCRLGDDIAGFLTADAVVSVASNGFSRRPSSIWRTNLSP